MPITTNPYCVVSDVKTVLGYDMTNTTDDSLIALLIPQAQDEIDDYLGFSYQQDGTLSVPTMRLFNGHNKPSLFIGETISVSKVVETTTLVGFGPLGAFSNGVSTLDITADILLGPVNVPTNFVLTRVTGDLFSAGQENYAVTGVFGFPSIPPRLTRACVRLVVHYLKMRDTNYADMVSDSGMMRQHFSKKMPEDVRDILDRMKHRNFITR